MKILLSLTDMETMSCFYMEKYAFFKILPLCSQEKNRCILVWNDMMSVNNMTQFTFLGSLLYIICRPLVRLSIANVNDRSNYSE